MNKVQCERRKPLSLETGGDMVEETLQAPATIKIGTCAWSYEDWRGAFYPETLAPTERLPFYAQHFSSVEIDSTFYAAPAAKTVLHWYEVTPPDFVFSCKLPREITHERRLQDCEELLEKFLHSIHPLGEKLGCVLIQLPPSFRPKRDGAALRTFLGSLPAGVRFAVEFRHPDWHQPRTVHLLEEHRICWAWTDVTSLDHQQEGAFELLPRTADFIYLRLLGDLDVKYGPDGQRRHTYRELQWPRDASLENWATRVRQEAPAAADTFLYLSNHFEGFAPATARRMASLLDIPLHQPPPEPAKGEPGGDQLDLL